MHAVLSHCCWGTKSDGEINSRNLANFTSYEYEILIYSRQMMSFTYVSCTFSTVISHTNGFRRKAKVQKSSVCLTDLLFAYKLYTLEDRNVHFHTYWIFTWYLRGHKNLHTSQFFTICCHNKISRTNWKIYIRIFQHFTNFTMFNLITFK